MRAGREAGAWSGLRARAVAVVRGRPAPALGQSGAAAAELGADPRRRLRLEDAVGAVDDQLQGGRAPLRGGGEKASTERKTIAAVVDAVII